MQKRVQASAVTWLRSGVGAHMADPTKHGLARPVSTSSRWTTASILRRTRTRVIRRSPISIP